MMADITSPGNRARGMGLIGAAFGLGLVLGPVLGGLLAGPDGSFLAPCLLAAGVSALAVPAAWRFLPESHRERSPVQVQRGRSLGELIRGSGSQLLLFQYVLHSGSVSAATYLFPLWVYALLGWQAREVGVVFGALGRHHGDESGCIDGASAAQAG